MFEHHHLSEALPHGNGSLAYFARKPNGSLLVFVHGFGGHATDTWRRMHEMAVLDPGTEGCDIVFYGYDSLRHRAMIHAATFRDFLDELTDSGGAAWLPADRGGAHSYRRIVISAHLAPP
jgi:hypothetical protein